MTVDGGRTAFSGYMGIFEDLPLRLPYMAGRKRGRELFLEWLLTYVHSCHPD